MADYFKINFFIMKTSKVSLKTKKRSSILKEKNYESLNGKILSKLKGGIKDSEAEAEAGRTDRLCSGGCGTMGGM